MYRPDGSGFTLGHETAGRVEAVGAGVRNVAPGRAVIVHAEFGCGECPTCLGGAQRYCPVISPAAGAGLGFDGGLAEFISVPSHAVLALPDGVDPVDAGPIDDAGLTPYHVIRTSMPWLEAGSVATLIGIGGLGHLAVQILRAVSSCTIVAVERDPERRKFALELGADLALDPADDVAAQVAALGGSSFVMDLVGSDQTLALGAATVARQGKLVCVGVALGSIPFGILQAPWECVLQTSYSGEAWELDQLLRLVAAGKVRVHANHLTLEEVPEALDRLDRGDHGLGRLIAIP
jgi:propanol-preferring alcohol dehydrogenase